MTKVNENRDRSNIDITEVKCQDCKFHTNRPSLCHVDEAEAYVGRKEDICYLFIRR